MLLVAKRRDYLDLPYLCVVEAKRDDFEQGLAQCLVEMYTCQWQHTAVNIAIDCFGIVTNATTWQFYKRSIQGLVYESRLYTSGDPAQLLGILNYVFKQCCLQASAVGSDDANELPLDRAEQP